MIAPGRNLEKSRDSGRGSLATVCIQGHAEMIALDWARAFCTTSAESVSQRIILRPADVHLRHGHGRQFSSHLLAAKSAMMQRQTAEQSASPEGSATARESVPAVAPPAIPPTQTAPPPRRARHSPAPPCERRAVHRDHPLLGRFRPGNAPGPVGAHRSGRAGPVARRRRGSGSGPGATRSVRATRRIACRPVNGAGGRSIHPDRQPP